MTLTEIDQALDDWQAKIAVATENLLILEDLPVVRRLRQEMGQKPPGLTGKTAARAAPALTLLPQLFQDISLLTDVLERARGLRHPLTAFWRPERTLDEIEELLHGPSVALPAVQTPFLERGLLSAPEQAQAITLGALLALMSEAFEKVKATLLEIEAAWSGGANALQAARDKAAVLEQMAAPLGETDAADLAAIQSHLKNWASLIASDPLGHPGEGIWEGAGMLRKTRERLESMAAARDKADSLREEAHSLMAQWEEAYRQAEVCRAECMARIATAPPHGSDRLPEMCRWLATLDDTYARRQWLAADIGFERWLQTGRDCLEKEKEGVRVGNAWLESAEELPGRFAALRAKAGARFLGSDPGLVQAGREAETVLRQKPLPLPQAETAVAAYAEMLNTLLKARSG